MSFYEPIDFSKYGINFDCNPDITKLPNSISSEIIPVKNQDGKIIFTKPDGSNIRIKLNTNGVKCLCLFCMNVLIRFAC